MKNIRRSYKKQNKPHQAFNNSYHINEVPLPYYNPLQDPYLCGFFSKNFNSKIIQRQGFLYRANPEYPYINRRDKNAYKHHKNNYYDVPASHRISDQRQLAKSMYQIRVRDKSVLDRQEMMSPKKKGGSQIVSNSDKKMYLLSQFTKQHGLENQPHLRKSSSSENRTRRSFVRKGLSAGKRMVNLAHQDMM